MKFQFKIQQYQTDAVEDTINVFRGQPKIEPKHYRRDLGPRHNTQFIMHNGRPYDGSLFAEENYELSIKNYELNEPWKK